MSDLTPPATPNLDALAPESREAWLAFAADRSRANLVRLVSACVREFSPQPPAGTEPLAGHLKLVDDLALDSLAVTELLFRFEDLANVKIATDELMTLKTVDELVNALATKMDVSA